MRFNLIDSLRSLFNARAIKKDPFSIVLLDNPSEKLLSSAVSKDSRVFLLLKNPSENVSRIAITKNPSFIKLIPNPSETLQLLAISKDPTQIVNIKSPTLKTQLKVVSASPECIKLIENPSIETIKVYVGNDYKRFWDLKLSNDKQEKVFNEIFRGKDSWNIPTEELISWLSNYTKIKANNSIKDIYNTIKDSINVDRMSIKQWQELITTGMCRVGKKEIVLSQKDGVYNININQETIEKQIEKQSDIKKENVKSDETIKITPEVERISPQQTHLRECLKGTKKKITEVELLGELKNNNLTLDEMTTDQISELIKSGETSIKDKTIKLKKEPAGYKIKITEKQNEQTGEAVKELPKMQLQESQESVEEIHLTKEQLKDIEKKGFANIPGGKIISKIQTPAGYTLKVYNVINTLTRQGQAEA